MDLRWTAEILKAVSEESRLRIVCILKSCEKCVCELQEAINAPHNLVLHHIKGLKKLGIIKMRKVNRFTFYSLDRKAWRQFTKNIDDLFRLKDKY